ncbi:MAG: HEAT repeat domain-containing protein [Candidatus Riflebacteria bacterium]|nr:HEAT repeat domain-containing protein [Candidatus Riflebacteria bacterium]
MRRQDELLALYPGQDRFNRKFILSEVDRLALAFDSDEMLDFLQQEAAAKDPLVQHQALFTLNLFLPGYVRRKFAIERAREGLWSSYAVAVGDLEKVEAQADEKARETDRRRKEAFARLTPMTTRLLPLLEHASTTARTLSRLAIAQFPLKTVNDRLARTFEANPAEFELLLAFAQSGGGGPAHGPLADLLKQHGKTQPDHLLLLSSTPAETAVATVHELSSRTDTQGRMNLAQALSKMEVPDPTEAVRHLARFNEGWVDVYCLGLLAATGRPALIDEVLAIHDRSPHRFVKNQAVRAAGSLRGVKAQEFCLESLKEPVEPVRAQALESLVKMRCPPEVLKAAAAPLLKSKFLRARVNALLATVEPTGQTLPSDVREMLMSDDPMARVEAAYCFGYWQSPKAVNLLKTLAITDPHPNVAAQAVKSLSKYPAETALWPLLSIMKERQDQVARTVARVMARYEAAEAWYVLQVLLSTMEDRGADRMRSLLYRTVGALAGKVHVRPDLGPLVRGLTETDPAILLGALEGVKWYGREVGDDARRALHTAAGSLDPRISARALENLILLGDEPAIQKLSSKLASPEEPIVLKALEVALELGVLASEVIPAGRFSAWNLEPSRSARGDSRPDGDQAPDQVLQCWSQSLPEGLNVAADLAEPDFEVHRLPGAEGAGGQPRPTPAAGTAHPEGAAAQRAKGPDISVSGRSRMPDTAASEISALAKHLAKQRARPQAGGGSFRNSLSGNTYLVGQDFTEESMELEPTARMIRRARRLAAFLGANRILLAPPVAVLVIIVIVVFGYHPPPVSTRSSSSSGATAGSVILRDVVGKIILRPGGTPLKNGDTVKAGQTVVSQEDSKARLVTAKGGRIDMTSLCEITVEGVSKDQARVDLTVCAGDYQVDFMEGGGFKLRLPPYTVTGFRARMSLSNSTTGMSVSSSRGMLTVAKNDGTSTVLEPGKTMKLVP